MGACGFNMDRERWHHLMLVDDIGAITDNLGEAKDMKHEIQNATRNIGFTLNVDN